MKSKKLSSRSAKSSGPDRGEVMNGAEILVSCLEREGTRIVFAYPGGASMPIHQALTKSKKIRVVLPRHEQGGAFAAEGYARATGRPGVCMATSGPGATNLVTGIADAFMDSVPLVAITGQVNQSMIGRGAFQETDVFGMTLPMVKHSYLVWDIKIFRALPEVFILRSGMSLGRCSSIFPRTFRWHARSRFIRVQSSYGDTIRFAKLTTLRSTS
jgi:acetolactate synthase-1/2/3 large subunit